MLVGRVYPQTVVPSFFAALQMAGGLLHVIFLNFGEKGGSGGELSFAPSGKESKGKGD